MNVSSYQSANCNDSRLQIPPSGDQVSPLPSDSSEPVAAFVFFIGHFTYFLSKKSIFGEALFKTFSLNLSILCHSWWFSHAIPFVPYLLPAALPWMRSTSKTKTGSAQDTLPSWCWPVHNPCAQVMRSLAAVCVLFQLIDALMLLIWTEVLVSTL